MKRSKFVEQEYKRLDPVGAGKPLGDLVDEQVEYDPTARRQAAEWRAEAAERAGVTWDPEEAPEVLWEELGSGKCGGWADFRIDSEGYKIRFGPDADWENYFGPHPAMIELRRRILAEREHVTDGGDCWCVPVTVNGLQTKVESGRERLDRLETAVGENRGHQVSATNDLARWHSALVLRVEKAEAVIQALRSALADHRACPGSDFLEMLYDELR